jgi:hypothetical protein
VQEEGVDEPSRVKLADGLAYALTDRRLVVVDTAAGAVVGTLDLGTGGEDGRWSSELLLLGDRVVVLGTASMPAPADPHRRRHPGATARSPPTCGCRRT